MKFRALTFSFLLLYLAAAFLTLRDNSFHNDDIEMIQKGARIFERPSSILEPDIAGRNHILLYLVMGGIHQGWGMTPRPFYLALLIFHAAVFFLLMSLGRRLGLDETGAGIAGLFFLVLGLHFQTVGWIAEMGRVLMNALLLASFIFFDRFRKTGETKPFVFCCLLWFLAFHASEEAMVLPALFGAYDFFIFKKNAPAAAPRKLLLSYVPLVLLGLGLLGYQFSLYRNVSPVYWSAEFQPLIKLKGLAWTLANLVIPRKEILEGGFPSGAGARLVLPLVFFLPALPAFVGSCRRFLENVSFTPLLIFSLLWFLIAFLPFALREVTEWRAYPQPRYLYLALLGVSFFIGKAGEILWDAARSFKPGAARFLARGGLALAGLYFYALNLRTFCFMAEKLDVTSRFVSL